MDHIATPFLRLTAGVALLLCLNSCGQSHLAEASSTLETDCWSIQDTLRMTFSNTDTSQVYQLYFPITFTDDYPYSNLYLRAVVRSPSGEENVLPSRFDLADPTGEWFTETSGDEVPFTLNIGEGLRLNQTGDYTISMYHYMRDDQVCGVREIGLVLDKVGG